MGFFLQLRRLVFAGTLLIAATPLPAQTVDATESARAVAQAATDLAAAKLRGEAHVITAAKLALGRAYAQSRKSTEALLVLEEAKSEAYRIGDVALEADSEINLGHTYQEMPDYASSIEHLNRGIELAKTVNANRTLATGYQRLAWTYSRLGQNEQALKFAELSLVYSEKIGRPQALGGALLAVGQRLAELKRFAEAAATFERGLKSVGSESPPRMRGALNNGLAESLAALDRESAALGYYREARRCFTEHGEGEGIYFASAGAARCLLHAGRIDDARAELTSVLDGKLPVTARSEQELYAALLEVEIRAGNTARALEWRIREAEARNRMEESMTQQRIAEVEVRARASEAQRQLDEARREGIRRELETERERSRQRMTAIGLALASLALAALVAFLIYRRRVLRRVLAETERARAQAEEADALKTRLLGIAAHDLRAPLSTIIGAAELLRSEARDESTRTMTEGIGREAVHLLAFIQDLLDASAHESGGLRVEKHEVDLSVIVDEALPALRAAAATKRQKIVSRTIPARLMGDPRRLRQVFDNLVSNALKFSPAGSVVHVAITLDGTDALLAVSDNGPGLTAADQPKLFVPFQKLSARPTAAENSTGLGLWIVRELVKLHGGEITVESQPGKGATFIVRLPRQKAEPNAPAHSTA